MAWKNVQYQNGKFKTTNGGGGGGSSTFADLDDVSFSNLQNGQVPKYNSTTQKWENANESGGGGTVTDVEVDGVSVVNQQGVAEITMPNIPVQDVTVDGTSVVNQQGVAQISIPTPPAPDYPVTDVKVNGTSVVSNKQASITSYKEVTLAEYQALPSSKLNDNILYCIKDSAGADGFPPLIYSDEEREVGVWYNGKPIYQKTFHYSETIVNSGVTKDISSLHIEDVIEISGIYTRIVSGYAPFNYAFNMYEASNLHSFVRVSNTDNSDLVWRIAAEGTDKQTITILYTKTTDTAGSGTWTTQGGYAHHYSTSEKVIGTWIDGKPLYEKVVQTTFSTTTHEGNQVYSGFIDISSEIPNINMAWIDKNMSWYNPTSPQTRGFFAGWYEQDEGKFFVMTLYSRSNAPCTLAISYTKTTD